MARPFCSQTELMFRASGGIPGMLGSYSGCPNENGVQFCVLFPTTFEWGSSRLLGYCLPSTCTLLEIARHVVVDPMLNTTFNYREILSSADANASQVADSLAQYINCGPRLSSSEPQVENIVSWVILGFLTLLVLLATLYDYFWEITARSIPFEVVMMGADGAVVRVLQPPNIFLLESKNKDKKSGPRHNDANSPLFQKDLAEKEGGVYSTFSAEVSQPLLASLGQSSAADETEKKGGSSHSLHLPTAEDEKAASLKSKPFRGSFVRRKGVLTPAAPPAAVPVIATTPVGGVDDASRGTGILSEFNAEALWSHRSVQKFLAEIPDVPDFRSFVNRTVLCLSLINSFRKWRYHPKSEVDLNLFNSWRVLAWMWVMIFSYFWYSQQIPTLENVGSRQVNILYAFLEKEAFAAFTVGTFLLIAGFLALHRLHVSEELLMKSPTARVRAERRRCRRTLVECSLWYAKYLVARLVRLIPISFAVLMLLPNAVSGAGHGPFWGLFARSPALYANCMRYWWTNLLLVNNIIPADENKRCFPCSYYVALEFQLVALAPLIYFLGKHLHHRLFFSLLILTMAGSAALRYIELSHQRRVFLTPSAVSHHALPVGTVYQFPHLMFIPFCLGAMLYYLYRALRQRAEMLRMFGPDLFLMVHRIQEGAGAEDRASYWILELLGMRRIRVFFVWSGLAITSLCVLSAWFIHREDERGAGIGVGVKAYESLILFPWCLALCLLALPLLFGYGGMLHRILTHRLWCGLSRLVLAAYLAAPVVIGFGNASTYEVATMNFLLFIVQGFGYMAVTLLVAFIFHMLVERPCLHISSRGEY
ncbi:transmembrane protein NRF-6 [Trypanosoma conorhini]|uniref:Transmembrane protein NRF-6 n=1 Tax=Trypanosoma conorhini TaxID=83891 RepID=A0A3R7NP75_9TRYP|nr:transmembrane protein NRF-6 [Trypanosoma conorhini]RNF21260.1 transmembrane protein NRF-6 [Trypanosoma conorhini]